MVWVPIVPPSRRGEAASGPGDPVEGLGEVVGSSQEGRMKRRPPDFVCGRSLMARSVSERIAGMRASMPVLGPCWHYWPDRRIPRQFF